MATSTDAPSVDAQTLLDRYERMLTIRVFEEEIQRRFLRGEVPGTTHLCIGQEAIAVGLGAALTVEDQMASTYRGHGHVLARGTDLDAMAAEMLAKQTGIAQGRSGSMNVIDLDHGLIGCFGIIGGPLAAACGAGLSLRGTGHVGVATFGEGTSNQGYFLESLNFAQTLKLPVLFVCENNVYSEYTRSEKTIAGNDVSARAAVLGMPTRRADGNDVRVVEAVSREALESVRAGKGPYFLEFDTYRLAGHSRSDPATYRPEGELAEREALDPLVQTRAWLAADGVSDDDRGALDARVQQRVLAAFEAALEAPYPDPHQPVKEYADV